MVDTNNIVTKTDSYKLNHWNQYPQGTETVYSYFESRKGATFPYTVFFGLQPILKSLEGRVVTQEAIDEARELVDAHLGPDRFNLQGWQHILDRHEGRLPLKIKAVPEGTVVPVSNVPCVSAQRCRHQCHLLVSASARNPGHDLKLRPCQGGGTVDTTASNPVAQKA